MACKNTGLRFCFTEINRTTRPCLDLTNASDLTDITDALTLVNSFGVQLDGCCTSRIKVSLAAMQNPGSDVGLATFVNALQPSDLNVDCPA